MFKNKVFHVNLDEKTYGFYQLIAEVTEKPLEEVLSMTLYKYGEIFMRETKEHPDKN